MFKRPSFFYTLLVTIPSVLFFGSVAILLGPLDFVLFPERRPGPIGLWVKKGWSRWMLKSHGLEIKVTGPGAKNLSKLKSAVFVSNHQSAIDILAHTLILPSNAHFVAKKELLWIPVFGWGARVVGTIFIDRKKGARENSLKAVADQLKNGNSVILYPEGTRSSDAKLKEFKRGAAVMAIEAKVPIVPMTIFNSGKLCPKKRLSIEPGQIWIYVDEPIDTNNLSENDRFELTKNIQAIIQEHLAHPPQSLLASA